MVGVPYGTEVIRLAPAEFHLSLVSTTLPQPRRNNPIIVLVWLTPSAKSELAGVTLFEMPKELFGTDGIRGIPGEYPLDDTTLYWVGRSLGGLPPPREPRIPRVLIGMDTRESGAHIASEIAGRTG